MRGLIYILFLRDFIYSTFHFVILFMRSLFGRLRAQVHILLLTLSFTVFMVKVICLLKQYFENGFKCLFSAAN